MAYDSEEQKKLAESIAKKTQMARELFKDEQKREQFIQALDQLNEALIQLQEKQKYEPLNEEELELLDKMDTVIRQAMITVSDAQLLLDNSLMVAATAQFFHVKRLAEEGNEDAKKVYEDLLPHFKNAMDPTATGKQNLN